MKLEIERASVSEGSQAREALLYESASENQVDDLSLASKSSCDRLDACGTCATIMNNRTKDTESDRRTHLMISSQATWQ